MNRYKDLADTEEYIEATRSKMAEEAIEELKREGEAGTFFIGTAILVLAYAAGMGVGWIIWG